jgi:general secretion pathway protein C
MSSLIRPSFHAFTLVMLACACLLVVQTVNTLLGASLHPLPTVPEFPRQEPAKDSEAPATPLSMELLARYTGLSLEGHSAPTPQAFDATVPTQLGLKLLGTMTSRTAGMSMASVYEAPTQRTRTVWVGSALQGAEILAIERTRVVLMNDGRAEILDITSIPPAPGQAALLPSPSALATGFGSTLRQTGPETYAIQRQDVENTLSNLNQIAMQARVVPSFINGVPKGFKLFAMRPDSIYARLGLKNGDILQRVNGYTLDSPTQALEAYNHLRGSSRIEIEVERDGQILRKTYSVEE